MYDLFITKLLFLILNGCKRGEFLMFAKQAKNHLSSEQFEKIRKTEEFIKLEKHFDTIDWY